MNNPKLLSIAELYQLREAYRHFNSMNSLVRAVDELIAIREARTLTVKLPSLKQTESGERYVWSDGVHNFKEDVIEVLCIAGVAVEGE